MADEKIFPRFQQITDFIETSADLITQNLQAKAFLEREEDETETFLEKYRAVYYPCEENSKLLEAFLYLHGNVPYTLYNLELAFRDLQADGLLRQAPAPAPAADPGNPSITATIEDRLMEYKPSDTESAQLAKLADDPNLSDHQRKARLRKLSLLAGQQRRELASENLYR